MIKDYFIYKDELRNKLQEYIDTITTADKKIKDHYICPFCHSGTGRKKTGGFSYFVDIDNIPRVTCFSCNSVQNSDIFDLIGKIETITNFNEQYNRACDMFGYNNLKTKENKTMEKDMPIKENIMPNSNTSAKTKVDYSDKYKIWNNLLNQAIFYLQGRGLDNVELFNKYQLGFNDEAQALVMPVTQYDYMYRYINKDNQKNMWNKGSNSKSMYNISLLQGKEIVFIVEDIYSMLTIEQTGQHAISLNSTNNYKQFIEELKKIKDNKDVPCLYFAFDNDIAGKKTATSLEKIIIEINKQRLRNDLKLLVSETHKYDIEIPENSDFNDILQTIGKEKFEITINTIIENIKKRIEEQEIKYNKLNENSKLDIVTHLKNSDIWIKDNCYMKNTIRNGFMIERAITNFIIQPIEQIDDGDSNSKIIIKIITVDGRELIRKYPTVSFYKATEFKKALNESTIDLYFKGNDDDLEDIKALLNTFTYPVKTGLKRTGIQFYNNKWVYVGNHRTFSLADKRKIKNNIVFINENENMESNIDTVENITSEELEIIKYALFNFNSTAKCLVILGFIGSCFIKEKLYKSNVKLNHLFLIGQAGSGKSTTLENVIMPIFGLDDAPTSADGITKFTLLKKSSNSYTIPFIIDEFKPYKLTDFQKNLLSDVLRKTYDKQTSLRGTPSQKINEYQHITPIILSGEGGLDETALTERKIQINFTKQDITPERTRNLNFLINNKNLLTKLGKLLINIGLKIEIEDIKRIHNNFYNKIKEEITDDRVRKNIANIETGLIIIKTLFEMLKVDMPINLETCKQDILSLVLNDTLDGGKSTKSVVDNMMELIDLMVFEDSRLKSMCILDVTEEAEELLYIDVTRIYKEVSKYIREHNLKDFEYINEKDFKKQLKDSEYCIDNRFAKKFKIYNYDLRKEENKTIKCFKLNLKTMNEKLELRHFKIELPEEF